MTPVDTPTTDAPEPEIGPQTSPPGVPAEAAAEPALAAPREIELKLELTPADWKRLATEPFITDALADAPKAKRTRAVYFDTPDRRLRAAGVSLRIRKSGRSRIQTAKAAAGPAGGLHDRTEIETPVSTETPDLAVFAETPLAPLFAKRKIREGLAPAFTVEMTRRSFVLTTDGVVAEAVIDIGTVTSGERSEPVCEMELELVSGTPEGLFALARRIAETVPARLGFRTKSDRGYALAAGETPQIVKKIDVAIDPTQSAGAAFRTIARACLAQLVANEPALHRLRAPGAVHQSRVALRRLRAALSLFRKVLGDEERRAISGELKWMANALGAARDLDVYIATTVEPASAASPDDPDLARVADAFAARRDIAYDDALAAASGDRYRMMLLDTVAFVEVGSWSRGENPARDEPVTTFAARLLKKRLKRIRTDGERIADLAPEDRHELRIEVKKLRYAVEFFESAFADAKRDGKKAAKRHATMLGLLEALQEDLGALNDLAVAGTIAADFPEPDESLARGLAKLTRPADDEAAGDHLRGALKAHAKLVDAKPFWR